MNEKAVAFAEANVVAGFELAQRLLHAKDPQEMGTVYQNHLTAVAAENAVAVLAGSNIEKMDFHVSSALEFSVRIRRGLRV